MLLFHLYKCVSGTLTTFTDVYHNLISLGINITPHILFSGNNPTKNLDYIHKLSFLNDVFNYNLGPNNLHKFISNDSHFEDDIIVTSCKSLYDIALENLNISFKCKHLIILDTWNYILADRDNVLDRLFNIIFSSSENQIFLGNPALFKWFDSYTHYEYYEKLNKNRLDFIDKTYNKRKNQVLFREDCIKRPHTKYVSINGPDYLSTGYLEKIFSCKEYHYCRWHHSQNPPIYFENIGKLIFEFNYMNKPVMYTTQNYYEQDGLTYYLKQCGIDDSFNQRILIPRDIIEKKLFMNSEDILVQILGELANG